MKNITMLSLSLGTIGLLAGCSPLMPMKSYNEPAINSGYNAESRKTIIPETCQSFNDGCNNCMKMDDGTIACTKMYCEHYAEPRCTDDKIGSDEYNAESRKTIIPETCQSFNDGCNQCMRMENGEIACTLMACEEYSEPRCTDGEIGSGEYNAGSGKTIIPETCKSFNDGCNSCTRQDDGTIVCTEMYCEHYAEPKCLDNETTNSAEIFIGKTLEEVETLAKENQYTTRIAQKDGESFPLTADYIETRLNLEIMSGEVVNAYFG